MHIKYWAPSRVHLPDQFAITLTEQENQIFNLLDECTQHLKEDKNLVTSCRVAGGWVRDKLLGSQSNDIDIALTDMMGYEFAEHFVEFAKSKGLPALVPAKIAVNPEQSKHLETARTTVLDTELDFVNLRNEEYANGSRIPMEVTFGTPVQDALRRDATINALFYNVHTRTVEDFTEKGLDDLRSGIIRTPLTPLETFNDDPLRVIRCVRFASRFGFELVPDLQRAAMDPAIQRALVLKVKKDRIGEELHKMMKGRDPLRSIELLNDLSLYSTLFTLPESITSSFSASVAPPISSVAAATILQLLLSARVTSSGASTSIPAVHPTLLSCANSSSDRARLFLAAFLTPFRGIVYIDRKDKRHQAVEVALREGVKLGTQNHYLDGIPSLFAAAEILKGPHMEKFQSPSERVALGLLLRDKQVHNPDTGSHWTSSILFSLSQELTPLYDIGRDELDEEKATTCIEVYNRFVSRVEELQLHTSFDARPILDGNELLRTLGVSKPGPWTGKALSKVVEWQLANPDGGKNQCEEWLKAEQSAGRIQITNKSAEPRPKKMKIER